MIKLIWAMDQNWLIGKDNKIPWHYKEDLLYYKEMTAGKNVLMGDKTYYSLKGYYKTKPLPYGKIYVASLEDITLSDAVVINDIKTFLANNKEDLWVVGGSTIYRFALEFADELYITHIEKTYDGDAYFPKFDLNGLFTLKSSRRSGDLNFCHYERKNEKCSV